MEGGSGDWLTQATEDGDEDWLNELASGGCRPKGAWPGGGIKDVGRDDRSSVASVAWPGGVSTGVRSD